MRNSTRFTIAVFVIGAALVTAGAVFARCADESCQPTWPDPTRTLAPLWTATPVPASITPTPSEDPGQVSVSADSNSGLPSDCQAPPPWYDFAVALACYEHYPPPLATPIPHCHLNYTREVWLVCWGYFGPVDPVTFPSPPPGGWPSQTPTPGANGYP